MLHSAPVFAQNAGALSGEVTSAKEGAMEGVVVSAKKDGATITVSVVSDDKGHFGFPASRLDPGHYAIGIRATGYDLDGPKDADHRRGARGQDRRHAQAGAQLDAQMTNAEWLQSMPGTDEQKRFCSTATAATRSSASCARPTMPPSSSRCSCAWPAITRAARR